MKYISIIICSRTLTINSNLSQNIRDTIGYAYELIVIDNSQSKYSIFEAYNIGIEKSKGDYLCFIHDDILFHTIGWGNIVNRIFEENKHIGLIGIAGAKVKTKMPSAWWDCPEDEKVINIMQHFPNKVKEKWEIGFAKSQDEEVVVIDGVFMVARKDDKMHFNTEMTGFHNYDLNISFEYKKHGYKIMVTNKVLLEHFSLGNLDETWLQSAYKIHKLYKDILPLKPQKCKGNKNSEVTNAIRFLNKCLKYDKKKMAFSIWGKLFLLKPVSKYHYIFLKRIFKNILC